MYKNNLNEILHLMAIRELDVSFRACSTTELPTSQRDLRWTVEEEAQQMVHIFDDLSTVRFNRHEKGVIRQATNARATVAFTNASSFYYMYHRWNKWDKEICDLLEQLLYLRAVKLAEVATGIRMDYNWLNNTLRKYGEHEHAVSIRRESPELQERIINGNFEPTEEEAIKLAEVFPDLEKTLDEYLTNMYGFVYTSIEFMWYKAPIVFGSQFDK